MGFFTVRNRWCAQTRKVYLYDPRSACNRGWRMGIPGLVQTSGGWGQTQLVPSIWWPQQHVDHCSAVHRRYYSVWAARDWPGSEEHWSLCSVGWEEWQTVESEKEECRGLDGADQEGHTRNTPCVDKLHPSTVAGSTLTYQGIICNTRQTWERTLVSWHLPYS